MAPAHGWAACRSTYFRAMGAFESAVGNLSVLGCRVFADAVSTGCGGGGDAGLPYVKLPHADCMPPGFNSDEVVMADWLPDS